MLAKPSRTPARRLITLIALGAALAAFGQPAAAAEPSPHKASQDKMPGSYGGLMKMKPEQIFRMIDDDKNGYVTKEEFMKFQEALFGKMDKNHDDQLSEQEFVARTHTGP